MISDHSTSGVQSTCFLFGLARQNPGKQILFQRTGSPPLHGSTPRFQMLFSTPFFLFVFLPIFFAFYWLIPQRRPILLLGSIIFYAWSEPTFILVVFVSALVDWLLGRSLSTSLAGVRRRKFLVAVGVMSNIGLLIYVKYAAFAITTLDALLGCFMVPPWKVPQIALPLGISFIVFEKITYLVDLYRGSAKPASSFLNYLNYVLLFPKLLAGPIVKYHDIAMQLERPSHCYEDLRDGLIRFVHGLAKKVIIADTLSPLVDQIFSLPASSLSTGFAWQGLICFTLQIYFDFSGYSDMAIGLGRILGFRLLENFNNPYLATSFTDFWRRWHISLSTWIKEYLYIPLGGNRVSTARSYINLCICFLLSGLWHGASWNFVIWGCLHGCALVADRAFWLRWQKALPHTVNNALTLLLVMLTWVFFRCPDFGSVRQFLLALSGATHASYLDPAVPQSDVICMIIIGICLVFAPRFTKRINAGQYIPPTSRRIASLVGCAALLLISVARTTVSTFHPFLYFRF